MYNFNQSKRKKQMIAIVSLILIVTMVVTTVITALFV